MALPKDAIGLYEFMKNDLDKQFPRVEPMDFYRALFPEGALERRGSEDDHQGRAITIELLPNDDKDQQGKPKKKAFKVRRAYVFDGLAELEDLIKADHTTVMAPMTYYGKARSLKNAHEMRAITIDLDEPRLYDTSGFNFFAQVQNGLQLPPTFTVLSGHGLHLYYVLEEPMPMYPANQKAAQTLKRALTEHIWTTWNSTNEKPQIEGINQGFRLVGGATKLGPGYRVLAWRSGPPVTLDQLTDIIRKPEKREAVQVMRQPRMKWEEAAAKYPEWAKKVKSGGGSGVWPVKRALYDWWLFHAADASYGHRYFYPMCLAIYAKKCGIPKEEAKKDALGFLELLCQNGPKDQPVTVQDVDAAFRAYDNHYLTFPRKTIEELTAIPIPPNKRNGRPQALHLARARAVQTFDDPEGKWRCKGAPSKEQEVRDYAAKHSDRTAEEVARDLGISPTTARKYMLSKPSKEDRVLAYVTAHMGDKAADMASALGVGLTTVYKAIKQVNQKPSKREQVTSYAASHPDASPTEIARATGISRPTVYKYLKAMR